jgi:glucosamine--fructose-6-phosphate aminotransferase (isomerizing)
VTITDVDGTPRERAETVVDWTPEAAEKGGYAHFMAKEIHEQPQALRQCIAGRVTRDGRIRLEEIAGLEEQLRSATRIELVACGSAYYAALVGAAALEEWTGLPARATVGSEFRYSPPPLDAKTLVIAVTQSGETADTIAPTRLRSRAGCPIVAVTNTVGSAITREADAVVFLQAGPEIAVAASKTFTTQVTTLVILAAGDRPGPRHADRRAGARARGRAACPAAAAASGRSIRVGGRAGDRPALRQLPRLHVRRARLPMPTALEGALKLKEVSYVHAEGYAAGELKHGRSRCSTPSTRWSPSRPARRSTTRRSAT